MHQSEWDGRWGGQLKKGIKWFQGQDGKKNRELLGEFCKLASQMRGPHCLPYTSTQYENILYLFYLHFFIFIFVEKGGNRISTTFIDLKFSEINLIPSQNFSPYCHCFIPNKFIFECYFICFLLITTRKWPLFSKGHI